MTDSRTGRDNEAIKLFIDTTKKPSRERVVNESVAKAMLDIRGLNKSDKIRCWRSLGEKDKTEVVNKTPFLEDKKNDLTPDDIREFLLGDINADPDEEYFDSIWGDENLEFIYSHSSSEWGLFKAQGCDGVYAIEHTSYKVGLNTWIKQLTHLAQSIDPDAKKIYLVIHRGDITRDEEVSNVDDHVYVEYVEFSHTNDDPYYKFLLKRGTDVDTIFSGLKGFASKIKAATDPEIDPIGKTYLDLIQNSNEGA